MGASSVILAAASLLIFAPASTQGLPAYDLTGLVGETVTLPCKVDTDRCGDLHSIKWYRGSARIFVFSDRARISRPEGEYTERAELGYSPNSTESTLKLRDLRVADEAVYKCEITYIEVREGCAVVQFINLTALIKPEYVKASLGNGTELTDGREIGPYTEGDELTLVCESGGGKPIAAVSWWNGTQRLPAANEQRAGSNGAGTGVATLTVRLGRGDLGAAYQCRATNDALKEPLTASLKLLVHVRPLELQLTGVKEHVVQGTNVAAVCQAVGANPPAAIAWYNGTDRINSTVGNDVQQQADGTFTTRNTLIFQATLYENERTLHCEASNPVMAARADKPMRKSVKLEVLYPPIVTVKPDNITVNESSDITLECEYVANPTTLLAVRWYRDKQLVVLNADHYEGGTTEQTTLLIKNATRFDQGVYECGLENDVGAENSTNSINVSIYFKPVVRLSMEPETPVSEVSRLNITLLCEVLAGNPATLGAVRWYLDGELLKQLPDCNATDDATTFCDVDPSRLMLEDVGRGFHANYSCEGMNDAGWGPTSPDRELVVFYPPGPATLVYEPSRVVKKGTVTLTCSVEDPGRPETTKFRWIRGSHNISAVTSANWTIDPVTLETESNFTCLAYNEGGEGEPATVFIEVLAPPAFIDRSPSYFGAPVNAQDIKISCRVECSPICEVNWLKNNVLIDTSNGSASPYTVINKRIPADTASNDFQSILSTLQWNMAAWPGKQLDILHDSANYTCLSTSNSVGPGVNSTTVFRVEYPPGNITVSNKVVYVTEGHVPEKVICNAKAYPEASYQWWKEGEKDPVQKGKTLMLGNPVYRRNSGNYICEASNRHGNTTQKTTINVLYKPECAITQAEMDGKLILTCSTSANPPEVDFIWRIKNENDTIEENVEKKGHSSILTLESYVENFRTYLCFANNSVGLGIPCERDVTGHAVTWWGRFESDHIIVIIAVIVGAILMVIIVCVIIIIVCRRKRADDKCPNPSATKDKSKPDLTSSLGDGLLQPDGDKAFYENLPFHGMQSAPNKSQLHQHHHHHHHHYNLTSHHLLINPTNTSMDMTRQPQLQQQHHQEPQPRQHNQLQHVYGSNSAKRNNRTYLPPLRLEYQQPYYVTDPYTTNSIVYADLSLSANGIQQETHFPQSNRPPQNSTEYAILKFHDVGQEIDV